MLNLRLHGQTYIIANLANYEMFDLLNVSSNMHLFKDEVDFDIPELLQSMICFVL